MRLKMRKWKITSTYKKSVTEYEYFQKDDKWITHEIGWRWGHIIIEAPDDVDIREQLGGREWISVYEDIDYDVCDRECDDGCWEDWDFEGVDEDEVAEFEAAWEEDWHGGVENLGWVCDENDLVLTGPFTITAEGEEGFSDYVESEDEDV